jgi:alkane 1-monooxygenase
MSSLPYYLVFILPATSVTGAILSVQFGWWYSFLTPVLSYIGLPLLDLIVGHDTSNTPQGEIRNLENRIEFRIVTWLWAVSHVGLIVWGILEVQNPAHSILSIIGIIVSVGTSTGGVGITVAHELMHKSNKFEQLLSDVILLTVWYMHFAIEHTVGHHTNVATPNDPATARRNESLYKFLPRTILGSYFSAWTIEHSRLHKMGLSSWSSNNRMIYYTLLPIILFAVVYWVFGIMSFVFIVLQAVFAFCLLEIVNYLEHYGLTREQVEQGKYERVSAIHSWESTCRMTNYFLFKLQRHADHHINPVRRYQALQHYDESPQLPTGYAGMILVALIPPLFKRLMNPRIDRLLLRK